MTKRKAVVVGVPVVLAFLFALVRPAWLDAAPQTRSKDEPAPPPKDEGFSVSFGAKGPLVDVQQPTRGKIVESVHAPGSVRSGGEVAVGAPFEGRISQLCVDEGDAVIESQVVFRLDPVEWEDKVREAELELARREASLAEAEAEAKEAEHRYEDARREPSTLEEARLKIPQAELGRDRAVALLENSVAKLARAREMLDQRVGKQEDVDAAEADRRGAQIALRIAEGELVLAKETLRFRERTWKDDRAATEKAIDTARTHVGRTRADLRAGQVALERARRDRERCDVRSPLRGIVTLRNVNSGDLVGRGGNTSDTTHYVVSDMTHVQVYADVDEGDVVKVKEGQTAKVRVNALGDDVKLSGRVLDVGNRAQQKSGEETKSFRVRLLLSPKDERLRPGMSANVDIETRVTAESALRIPLMGVLHKARKDIGDAAGPGKPDELLDCVYVLEGETAKPRLVSLGVSDGEVVEVTKGVEEGDWVVLGPYRALDALHAGDHVRPNRKEPPKPEAVAAVGSAGATAK